MTRKAGLSPANKLPLITYKRGASQQTVCELKKKKDLKEKKKYHTGHSGRLHGPLRDFS